MAYEGGGLLNRYFRIVFIFIVFVFPAQGFFLGSTSNTEYLS